MKKLFFKGFAAIAVTLIMLTSCLGDKDTTLHPQGYGVIKFKDRTPLLYMSDYAYPVTSSGIDSEIMFTPEGVPVFYYAAYDPEDENNLEAKSKGYYVGTVSYAELSSASLQPYLTDTTQTVSRDEQILTGVSSKGYACIQDWLLIQVSFDVIKEDQKNRFGLSFSPNQEVETNPKGEKIYDLYLRVSKTEEGKGTEFKNDGPIVGFYINQLKRTAKDQDNVNEDSNGNKYASFRINYPTEISADSTKVTKWEKSDVMGIPYTE